MSKPSYVYVTYIVATPEQLWQAITDAGVSTRYWGHANVSDWRANARWEHRRGNPAGEVDIVGTVIESAPPRRLVVTWANPAKAAQPDEVSRVTFEIADHKDGTVKLTVTHSGLNAGSSMEQGITRGWPLVLSAMKTFLETGKSLPL